MQLQKEHTQRLATRALTPIVTTAAQRAGLSMSSLARFSIPGAQPILIALSIGEILAIGLERDGDVHLEGHDSATGFTVTIRGADGTETVVQQGNTDGSHHVMSHDQYVRAHLDAIQARYQELSRSYLNAFEGAWKERGTVSVGFATSHGP